MIVFVSFFAFVLVPIIQLNWLTRDKCLIICWLLAAKWVNNFAFKFQLSNEGNLCCRDNRKGVVCSIFLLLMFSIVYIVPILISASLYARILINCSCFFVIHIWYTRKQVVQVVVVYLFCTLIHPFNCCCNQTTYNPGNLLFYRFKTKSKQHSIHSYYQW